MNKVLKWIIIACLFLVPFTPLIISSDILFPFITGKGFFFRIIVDIAFFTYFVLAVRDPQYRPKKSWLLNVTTLFLIVVLLADTFGVNPHKSFWSNFERMEGFFMILHLWMFFVVSASILSKKLWHYFFATSIGVSLLVAWYGLFQLAGKIDIRQGADRLDGTIGNAAYLAVYMLLNMGFATYLYVQHKVSTIPTKKEILYSLASILISGLAVWVLFVKIAKISSLSDAVLQSNTSTIFVIGFWAVLASALVYFAAYGVSHISQSKKYLWFIPFLTTVFLQFHIIFKSSTRGSIIGLILGIIVASIIYAWKAKEDAVGRKIAWGFLGLIVIATVGFISIRKTDFVQGNTTLRRLASISLTDRSQARAYIWPIAFKGVLDRPVLGYGQDGFNYVFNKYYDPAMYDQEQWFDRAHNVFLDWLIAAGIPGFALYLALYVLVILYIWKGEYTVKEKSVLIGLVVAYAFHNLTIFDNIPSYILFFAFLAFLHQQKAKDYIKNIDIQVDVRDLIVIPLCIIVGVSLLYFVNIRSLQTGTQIIDAMRRTEQGYGKNIKQFADIANRNTTGSQEVREMTISNAETVIRDQNASVGEKQQMFELARKAIDAQIAYAPKDARMYLIAGSFYNRLGQFELAMPLLEKAHELTPQKQAPYIEMASAYLNQKKWDKALEVSKKALDLAPSYPMAQTFYMISLSYAGKPGELENFIDKDYKADSVDDRLVGILLSNKRYDIVVQIYNKVISAQSQNTDLRKSLSGMYFMIGNRNLAISTLEKAIVDIPRFKEEGERLILGIRAGKNPIQQ